MARYHRAQRKRSYSGRDYGRERALQHIEDARRLSDELGGTDQDVKKYFFSLSSVALEGILAEYGRIYGTQAREYAAETMQKWRSGSTQMSGTVAERLFNLLPARMPLADKYKLTEGLWAHYGPSSRRVMVIGLDASIQEVIDTARRHIDEVVTQYRIPDQLQRRFQWLSSGDVGVKQDLLNHLRAMERAMVVEAARVQLPVLVEHLKSGQGIYTKRLAQVLKVAKHELEILIDSNASGVRMQAPGEHPSGSRNSTSPVGNGSGWLWIIAVIGVILFMLLRH